jgi:alkylation response protein AidB-like acyl-CoA dehydrogenase
VDLRYSAAERAYRDEDRAAPRSLADGYSEVDAAPGVARYASWAVSGPAEAAGGVGDPVDLAAFAAAYVSRAIPRAAGVALQVLGGVVYTWEPPVHLYYTRALSSARLLGAHDEYLDRIASGLGLGHQERR